MFYATMTQSQAYRNELEIELPPNGVGYVKIHAHTRDEARAALFNTFGARWSFLYSSLDEMDPRDRQTEIGAIDGGGRVTS